MNITKFCENGELLPILLASGMNPHIKDEYDYTYLHIVEDLETAKFLVESGLDVNVSAFNKITPLYSLLTNHNSPNIEILKYFIEKGADVNKRFIYDLTPLIISSKSDENTGVVEALLKAGANVDDVDFNGGFQGYSKFKLYGF